MAYVSAALGCQPAPTPDECICADCGVNCHGWRNSYFLRDGEVLLRCEDCGERAAIRRQGTARKEHPNEQSPR